MKLDKTDKSVIISTLLLMMGGITMTTTYNLQPTDFLRLTPLIFLLAGTLYFIITMQKWKNVKNA